MAQTGFTPLLIYSSSTATNAPTAGNLLNNATGSELAINIADGKLFYKDSGGSVQVIAWKTTPTTAGGTGLTSYTAGDLPYYASGTAFTKLGIGTSGYFLTSSGSAPQWTDPTTLAVTSISFGTTGLTPSTATKGAVTVAGTLVVGNGGTGLTSLTAGYIPYGNGTSAFNSSSTLTYNGTTLSAGNFVPSSSSIPSNGIYLPSTNSLGFSTNSTLAATIFSSGGVSIGNTTDPGAGNLSVTGEIYCAKGIGSTQSFSAYQSTTQTIANGTSTKVQFQTKEWDTASKFDATTNYRFSPTISGYYQVNACVGFSGDANAGAVLAIIFANGSPVKSGTYTSGNAFIGAQTNVSTLIYLTSGDYIEVYAYQGSFANQNTTNAASSTYFQAALVRGV